MHPLEVFFDYACPFCLRGHEYLMQLLPEYPGLSVIWRPCEAHPRPDRYGPHSDLCIQGLFFAQQHGADIGAYHLRMYEAALGGRINIEEAEAVAQAAAGLLDTDLLCEALRSGTYRQALGGANAYAYETCGVWAVPSYRMGGERLDAVENVGVSKAQLEAFIAK